MLFAAPLIALSLAQARITHPGASSPVRKAILASIRPFAFKDNQQAQFHVAYIAVKGSAALAEVSGVGSDEDVTNQAFGTMGELTACFMERVDGAWKPIGFITDPHEGFASGNGMVVDLRGLKQKGFTLEMFQPSRDDMLKNLSTLDSVRKLGWLYSWACPVNSEKQVFYKVTDAEVDSAAKLPDGRITVRGIKCDLVTP